MNDTRSQVNGSKGDPAFVFDLLLRYVRLLERYVALLEPRATGSGWRDNGSAPAGIFGPEEDGPDPDGGRF